MQTKPIRTWNPTPFAMGPRTRNGSGRRRPLGHAPSAQPRQAPAVRVAPSASALAAPKVEPPKQETSAGKIKCQPGGPYLCQGVMVETANGGVSATDKPVALCACGRSAKKPYCDGTHSKADAPAPESSET